MWGWFSRVIDVIVRGQRGPAEAICELYVDDVDDVIDAYPLGERM
jgi:hypothetical protein